MKTLDGARHVRLATALVLVATFGLGTLTGATLVRWSGPFRPHHPHGARPVIGPWLMDDLSLSASQRKRAEPIFRKHREGLDALLTESFPRVRELNARIEAELRELLDAEQQLELDALRAAAVDGPPAGPPTHGRRGPPPPGTRPDGPPRGWGDPPPAPAPPAPEQ